MAQHTRFGKDVKKALIEQGHTGAWLVGQVRERTGMYFDDPYLSKLLSGKKKAPHFQEAIRQILGLSPEQG